MYVTPMIPPCHMSILRKCCVAVLKLGTKGDILARDWNRPRIIGIPDGKNILNHKSEERLLSVIYD